MVKPLNRTTPYVQKERENRMKWNIKTETERKTQKDGRSITKNLIIIICC